MADEPDNLVLKLLREIREDIALMKAEMQRDIEDLREANASVIGYVHQVALKQTRIDRDIIALHNRVTALETHTGLVRDL